MPLLVNIQGDRQRVQERRKWCLDAAVALDALGKVTVHEKLFSGLDTFAELLDFGLGIGAGVDDTDWGEAAEEVNFATSTFNAVVLKVDEKLAAKRT